MKAEDKTSSTTTNFQTRTISGGLSALTALNIAIREEFMLKKLSISIDFVIT